MKHTTKQAYASLELFAELERESLVEARYYAARESEIARRCLEVFVEDARFWKERRAAVSKGDSRLFDAITQGSL